LRSDHRLVWLGHIEDFDPVLADHVAERVGERR
jgi:hypothetical protein